jgi:hypothetical protein
LMCLSCLPYSCRVGRDRSRPTPYILHIIGAAGGRSPVCLSRSALVLPRQ